MAATLASRFCSLVGVVAFAATLGRPRSTGPLTHWFLPQLVQVRVRGKLDAAMTPECSQFEQVIGMSAVVASHVRRRFRAGHQHSQA